MESATSSGSAMRPSGWEATKVLVHLGVLGGHVGDQWGVDQTEGDGVDSDAPVGVVEGRALGQADLRVLPPTTGAPAVVSFSPQH